MADNLPLIDVSPTINEKENCMRNIITILREWVQGRKENKDVKKHEKFVKSVTACRKDGKTK